MKFLNNVYALFFIGVWIQTLAIVGHFYIDGSELGSYFFLQHNVSENLVKIFENIFSSLMILSLVLYSFKRKSYLLIFPFIGVLVLGVGPLLGRGELLYQLSMGEQSAKLGLVLGLIFLGLDKKHFAQLSLKIGIGLTFIIHGIKCFYSPPNFLDYLLDFFEKLNWSSISNEQAQKVLLWIGILDLFVGTLGVLKNYRTVWLYMIVWGGLTSFERFFYQGLFGIIPMFIRSAHFIVPMILYMEIKKENVNEDKIYPFFNPFTFLFRKSIR